MSGVMRRSPLVSRFQGKGWPGRPQGVDGGVVRWAPDTGTAEEVVPYRPNPGFIRVAGPRLACYDGTDVVVVDLDDGGELLRVPAQAEKYGGHSPQMAGTLSTDGCLLALCTRPGEI